MKRVFLGIADIHFSSLSGLRANFAELHRFVQMLDLASSPTLNLRIHWQESQLTPEYQLCAMNGIRDLANHYKGLKLLCYLPQCFHDPLNLSQFANCDQCVFNETSICNWPNQIKSHYIKSPQKQFASLDLDRLTSTEFRSRTPLTWITPTRREVQLCNDLMNKSSQVIDFGCGTGFLDYLLLHTGLKHPLLGIDPFVTPQFKHPLFAHKPYLRDLPQADSRVVLSSLADFNIPLEKCLAPSLQVEAFVFYTFPDVFGLGGCKMQIELKDGKRESKKMKPLFSFADHQENFSMVYHSSSHSYFNELADFRIYIRSDKLEKYLPLVDFNLPSFPWENSLSPKNPTISTLALS